jgi:hypothetical protein
VCRRAVAVCLQPCRTGAARRRRPGGLSESATRLVPIQHAKPHRHPTGAGDAPTAQPSTWPRSRTPGVALGALYRADTDLVAPVSGQPPVGRRCEGLAQGERLGEKLSRPRSARPWRLVGSRPVKPHATRTFSSARRSCPRCPCLSSHLNPVLTRLLFLFSDHPCKILQVAGYR